MTKLKISLFGQLAVAIGVFVALFGALGFAYLKEESQQDDLASQLSVAQRALAREAADIMVWEDRLASGIESVAARRASFPAVQPSAVLLDLILQMASESGLNVLQIDILSLREEETTEEQQKPATRVRRSLSSRSAVQVEQQESEEMGPYVASPFHLSGQGTPAQVYAFLDLLEQGPLQTLVISQTTLVDRGDGLSLAVDFAILSAVPVSDVIAPSSHARPLPPEELTEGTVRVEVPFLAMDTIDGSGIDYVELYYSAGDEEPYSKYVTEENTGGQWRQSPIPFEAPFAQVYEVFTRAFDLVGNAEEVPMGPDVVLRPSDSTPPPAPQIASDIEYTAGELRWAEVADGESGMAGYFAQVSRDSSFTSVESYERWSLSTSSLVPGLEEGVTYYFRVKAKDNAGNNGPWSAVATLTADTTAPVGSVTISGGASYADSASVVLSLNATDTTSGIAHMALSHDGLQYTPWEPFAPNRTWELGQGSPQTVYVKFRDVAGNESLPYADTIVLDTTPPAVVQRNPAEGAGYVGLYPLISVQFTEEMDEAALTGETFYIVSGDTRVEGAVSWNAEVSRLIFIPAHQLSPATTYTATVTTRARDVSGLELATRDSWQFTTLALPAD